MLTVSSVLAYRSCNPVKIGGAVIVLELSTERQLGDAGGWTVFYWHGLYASRAREEHMRSRKPISICFILCVSVAAVAMPHPASAEGPEFVVDASWPKPLPNNWILGQVAGIAVDDQDHVWVLHRPRTLSKTNAAPH